MMVILQHAYIGERGIIDFCEKKWGNIEQNI